MITESQAKDVLEILLASYPTQSGKLTSNQKGAMVRAYYAGLVDLDFAALRLAVARIVKSSEFIPSIAAIRAAVVDQESGPKRGGGEAWADVLRAMSRKGAYRTPGVDFTFDDPLVMEALKLFVWRDLCTSEDLVADRAHFIRHYDGLAATTRKETQIAIGAGSTQAALPSGSTSTLADVIAALPVAKELTP